MAQVSTQRFTKKRSQNNRNGSSCCVFTTVCAFFILIMVNMVYMNYRVAVLAPIETVMQFPVINSPCCTSTRLAKCIACSMRVTVERICRDIPNLEDCPHSERALKTENLRGKGTTQKENTKDTGRISAFDSLESFESYILNSISKEELIQGSFPDITEKAILEHSDKYGDVYKHLPRDAMKFAYSNYERYAFGHDELKPKSGKYNDRWGGNGVTLIDSLDTLWIMGFKDEFYRGRDWVVSNLNFNHNKFVSFFETTIRDLGGLLSAYYLSEEKIFLEKAEELGRKLFVTFEKDPLPKGEVNLVTGETRTAPWLAGASLLAEIGTCQLEFGALGKLIGDKRIHDLPRKVIVKVEEEYESKSNLFPITLGRRSRSNRGGQSGFLGSAKKKGSGKITFGGTGDSYYEYLLKFWVQSDFQDTPFRNWYEQSVQGLVDYLIFETKPNKLTLIASANYNSLQKMKEMDHLACFTPGMLALGVHHAPKDYPHKERDLTLAKKLMYSCVEFYLKNPTGLSPEIITVDNNVDFKPKGKDRFYLLRPEMVESLYILHEVTRHPIYRIWGKMVMENIEKYCKTNYGYGAYPDVLEVLPAKDSMESFFLAETLKYHYLLQTDETEINLDEWVFNTEAHPLKIFK